MANAKTLYHRRCLRCTESFSTFRRLKIYCSMFCQMRAKSERQAGTPQRYEWLQEYYRRAA